MKNEAEKVIGARETFFRIVRGTQGEIVWLGNFPLKREMTERATIDPDNQECNEESEEGMITAHFS